HDGTGHDRIDALEGLVVAKPSLNVGGRGRRGGRGRLSRQLLQKPLVDPLDVALGRLGPKRKGSIEPDCHFRRASTLQVAAESRWNLHYEAQVSAPQAFLEV